MIDACFDLNGCDIKILSQSDVIETISSLFVKLEKIFKNSINLKITILPDFFIDRVIQISNVDDFVKGIYNKIEVGGGSMRGLLTKDIKGGNAINIGYCLAKLGASIELFTITDGMGQSFLMTIFENLKKNINFHFFNGKHGLTTIFEFSNSPFNVSNVMISDVGDNDNFGPNIINSIEYLSTIGSSDAVVLTNWASNLRGTALMKFIFSNSPGSIHFIDPADFKERRFEFINDLKNHSSLIDFLSINENEFRLLIYAILDVVPNKYGLKSKNLDVLNPNILCIYSLFLARFFKIKICIHTVIGCILSDGLEVTYVPSFPPSQINVVSGAGDSWDSAFLFGQLLNFSVKENLCFANLYARLYLENSKQDAPTLKDVINIIKKEYVK